LAALSDPASWKKTLQANSEQLCHNYATLSFKAAHHFVQLQGQAAQIKTYETTRDMCDMFCSATISVSVSLISENLPLAIDHVTMCCCGGS
jgi:hypothetical protein